jgi:hypothetical protein
VSGTSTSPPSQDPTGVTTPASSLRKAVQSNQTQKFSWSGCALLTNAGSVFVILSIAIFFIVIK